MSASNDPELRPEDEALLADLIAGERDADSDEAKRVLAAAGLTDDDLAEMRQISASIDFLSPGQESAQEDASAADSDEDEALGAAVSDTLQRLASGNERDQANVAPAPKASPTPKWLPWIGLAAAALLVFMARGHFGASSTGDGNEVMMGTVEGEATLSRGGNLVLPRGALESGGTTFAFATRDKDGSWTKFEDIPRSFQQKQLTPSLVDRLAAAGGPLFVVWPGDWDEGSASAPSAPAGFVPFSTPSLDR